MEPMSSYMKTCDKTYYRHMLNYVMTFIGFTSGVKGWKFMQNTNTIFHATKAVFDENMYPQCPDGSHVNIPAIETGVLPPPDSYLDRDNNIPLEDGDQPPPPLPVETDSIWCHGPSWPYVPDVPHDNGDDDSQPPSLPPSPGLSYRTPRTPSLRHRSATLSHHSSGETHSRLRTLTEPVGTSSCLTEISQSRPVLVDYDLGARWEYEDTMSDGTTQLCPVSPLTLDKLMTPIRASEGTSRLCPVSPLTIDQLLFPNQEETSRAMARRQALESPLAPRSLAIPQSEIASYPEEWRDDACTRRYSHIPSYQGWHRGEQPELAQSELAGPSIPTEWPLGLVPEPST